MRNVFRSFGTQPALPADPRKLSLGALLVHDGLLRPDQLDWALSRQRRHLCQLGDVFLTHDLVSEPDLYRALARQHGTSYLEPGSEPAAPGMVDRLGANWCAVNGILPIRHAGGTTIVATSRPARFEAVRGEIEDRLGPAAMVVMTESGLKRSLTDLRQHRLAADAETRVPTDQSCRDFDGHGRWIVAGLTLGLLIAAIWTAPVASFVVCAGLAGLVLAINTGLLVLAMGLSQRAPPPVGPGSALSMARLPRVSLLVPLYRERQIASALIQRLSVLDYPRELLEVHLVVEQGDAITRAALDPAALPRWMRVIAVPDGALRTKPRAMNYALDFCAGEVVGIYDAEDAPPADQLRRVVQQFATSPVHVGCLQGRLNFYNPRASWLTQCFTIDYSTWFGLVLPALHRLGWALPLGGTTVFFRRPALERVGAWDAHNVTEDADLGMRLARFGYRTDLLDSTTLEEATSSPKAWIAQRSRWLKGYAITWAVHMRNPVRLFRELGAWRFAGFQVLFLCNLLSTILAPVLWSFWLLTFDLPHPLRGTLDGTAALLVIVALFAAMILGFAANAQALLRMNRGELLRSVPLMHLYFPLATIAMAKALWELLACPFFWHKTSHGVTQPDAQPIAPDHLPNRV